VDELYWHFDLLDPIGKAANMLNNLHMKSSDKIFMYNVDFIYYTSQYYDSKLKVLSNETTLVLSNTRELDSVLSTK